MTHQAHDALSRKLRMSAEISQEHLPAALPGLLALTDPVRTPDPVALARGLFRGCGLVYRHFGAPDRASIAASLAGIARENELIFLVGNDPILAQSVGAHGVHWPEARLEAVADWSGQFRLMTAAAHCPKSIARAKGFGLDGVLVSPIFVSESPSAGAAIGVNLFRDWVEQAQLPVYGLGGVTADNVGQIHNIAGSAMIGGIAPLAHPVS